MTTEMIYKYSTLGEYQKAKAVYDDMINANKDMCFIIATIYKAGIIDGKRQERARRKRGIAPFVGGVVSIKDQLKRLCEKLGIRCIDVEAANIEQDTIIYNSKLKVMFASEHLTDKTMQVTIDYLKGGVSE